MAINWIFLHHTAVSRAKAPKQLASVNAYHKQEFGVKSKLGYYVGYNYFIEPDGSWTQTREDGEEQTAQIGYNKNSISICLAGDFDKELPTPDQKNTLKNLLRAFKGKYGLTNNKIKPHRYVCGRPNGIVKTSTINGLPAYKTCYGSKLSDEYFTKDL